MNICCTGWDICNWTYICNKKTLPYFEHYHAWLFCSRMSSLSNLINMLNKQISLACDIRFATKKVPPYFEHYDAWLFCFKRISALSNLINMLNKHISPDCMWNKICKKSKSSFWTLESLVRPRNVLNFCIITIRLRQNRNIKFPFSCDWNIISFCSQWKCFFFSTMRSNAGKGKTNLDRYWQFRV